MAPGRGVLLAASVALALLLAVGAAAAFVLLRHRTPDNLAVARAMFDRVDVGMSIHRAADVMDFDSRSPSWGKDFGLYDKPDTVRLAVYFLDDAVARAEIYYPYEPGNRGPRGRVVAEKGLPFDEWERRSRNQ